ncbi:phosphatidylinositol/phosphatidylcholine transfer protein SFH5-like [Glycine max]|uniref:phosphatidylinositol/phosphatidylcholine transfer protein SFH5-like n=1 Tax=Glycine max TaxID=3847 RepID=UPI001B354CD2|nr:phosphatidylinositol/phosphatidylcholine transfer protein SFH5-like [Glycine max]
MLNLHVLGNKFQSRLLQIIDTRFVFMFVLPQLIKGFYVYYNAYHVSIPFCLFFNSQLPDFLGGSCSCPNDGGCLRSDKGPWNDPDILKLLHSREAMKLTKFGSSSVADGVDVKSYASKVKSTGISEPLSASEVRLNPSAFVQSVPSSEKVS